MTLYQLLDLAQSVSSRIDVQWGFFITVHLALLGGIIYVDRPLRRTEKLIGFGVYVLFACFNFRLLRTQQELLATIHAEIAGLPLRGNPGDALIGRFEAAVADGQAGNIFWITVAIHVISLLVVLASFITDAPRKGA